MPAYVHQKILVPCREVFPRENVFVRICYQTGISSKEKQAINDNSRLKVNHVLLNSFVQN